MQYLLFCSILGPSFWKQTSSAVKFMFVYNNWDAIQKKNYRFSLWKIKFKSFFKSLTYFYKPRKNTFFRILLYYVHSSVQIMSYSYRLMIYTITYSRNNFFCKFSHFLNFLLIWFSKTFFFMILPYCLPCVQLGPPNT